MTIRAADLLPPAYPPAPTLVRQIVVDFLVARLAANNARIHWLLAGTPEALTAWVDAENNAQGDTE